MASPQFCRWAYLSRQLPSAPTGMSGRRCPNCSQHRFPGVKTSRDAFLVDVDLHRLKVRINDYFNPDLTHEEVAHRYPAAMKVTAQYDARTVRAALVEDGSSSESGFTNYDYRPFDTRWIYWESKTKLLDRPRPDYKPHVFEGNLWLEAREKEAQEDFSRGVLCRNLADNFGNGLSSFFPAWLRDDSLETNGETTPRRPNLSPAAQRYLQNLDANVEDLFHHVLAVLHDPAYREANAGALRMEWPRIPSQAGPTAPRTEPQTS